MGSPKLNACLLSDSERAVQVEEESKDLRPHSVPENHPPRFPQFSGTVTPSIGVYICRVSETLGRRRRSIPLMLFSGVSC